MLELGRIIDVSDDSHPGELHTGFHFVQWVMNDSILPRMVLKASLVTS